MPIHMFCSRHQLIAHIGLLGAPSYPHHELAHRQNQLLVQRQHLVVLELRQGDPLYHLPLFPFGGARSIRAASGASYRRRVLNRRRVILSRNYDLIPKICLHVFQGSQDVPRWWER